MSAIDWPVSCRITDSIEFRRCTVKDVEQLSKISSDTFYATFYAEQYRHVNKRQDILDFITESYNHETLTKSLLNPESVFYFVYCDGCLCGHIAMHIGQAQSEVHTDEYIELGRLYITHTHQGKGLGSACMQFVEQVAATMSKSKVWLGVWELNAPALRFYEKMGYTKYDQHVFKVGDDLQTDFMYIKHLTQQQE